MGGRPCSLLEKTKRFLIYSDHLPVENLTFLLRDNNTYKYFLHFQSYIFYLLFCF